MMPPEPARPHVGPWRIEHPEHLTAPLLLAADGTELYYLERVNATAADDALVAAAPVLHAALERCIPLILDEWEGCSPDSEGLQALAQARAALHAATAPAAPGE